jgi:hypothetical protein
MAAKVQTGLTPSQQQTADRYVQCLVRQREIPPRLKKEFQKIPKEEEISPALQNIVDDVMGRNGTGTACSRPPTVWQSATLSVGLRYTSKTTAKYGTGSSRPSRTTTSSCGRSHS